MRRTAWTDASGRPRGPKIHGKIMIRTHTLNLHIDCNKLFFPTCCLGTLGSGCLRVVVGVSVSSGFEPGSVEVEEVEDDDDGRHFWN